MQRKKPSSAKHKKARLQQKRAIKRGDIEPPPPSKPDRHKKARRAFANPSDPGPGPSSREAVAESTRRLQSSFVKLPQSFLEHSKELAATLHLERPIPPDAAVLRAETFSHSSDADQDIARKLICPKRPKWRYDMTKKEVEKNEEGLFKKWLDQADDIVHDWCNPLTDTPSAVDEDETRLGQASMNLKMPRAPTSFERNLEVWRQLWRVSEISQIILILLDSRCPLLHFPPSLSAYLSSPHIANRTRTILVLTKVDITGPTRTNEWTRFLRTKYPRMPVVRVESYAEIGETPAGKGRPHQPRIPLQFRQSLVQALREMHAELLEPPVRLRDHPERLTNWRPPVRQSISWDAVLNAHGGQVGTVVGGAAAPRSNPAPYGEDPNADLEDGEENGPETEPEYLTVGLIGVCQFCSRSESLADAWKDETFPNAFLDA